ncbi:MAG TPA: hypothetical protein HPP94_06140 [Desulfuromonadales bacterium]|nr:hypothetical protein [Desulfuromonadales bacterium]
MKMFIFATFFAIVTTTTCLITSAPSQAELLPQHSHVENSVNKKLLQESSSVDVVYSTETYSHIEYQKKTSTTDSTEPTFPEHVIVRPTATPFGTCQMVKGTFQRGTGKGYCGIVLKLSPSAALNLAAMDSLKIEGTFSGRWRLALADRPYHLRDENLPTDCTLGLYGASLDLAPHIQKLDLTRVISLVLLLDSLEGTAAVERIKFSRSSVVANKKPDAIWIWNNRAIAGHEQEVVERLTSLSIKQVYLQIDDYPGRLLPFVAVAKKKGIAVWALDGDPEYVRHPEALLRRIRKVADLIHSTSEPNFSGFQVDIEPYLNKDFALKREQYLATYLELLDNLKKQGDLPLSVVVPFWFDSMYVGGTSLLQKVIEIADELVVMSYRTDPAELLAVARTELGLAEKLSKPVRLGIELGRIPDERHIELVPAVGQGEISLGGMLWKKKADYTVSGNRISFRNRKLELPGYMATPIPFRSFDGWVLHSYEELDGIK